MPRPVLSGALLLALVAPVVVVTGPAYAAPVGIVVTPGGEVLDVGSGVRCQVAMDEEATLCAGLEADPGDAVSYLAEPMGGFEFARWETTGDAAVPCVEAGGATTWAGVECSFVVPPGGVGLQATFVDDDPPKALVVERGPTGPVNAPPAFVLTDVDQDDPTLRRARCGVLPTAQPEPSPGTLAACPLFEPHTVADPGADGEYTFWAFAEDWSGNFSAEPVTRDWTYDRTAPRVWLDDRPSRFSNDTRPAFAFSSDEVVAFACRLDRRAIPCQTFRVGNGRHTFVVTARDAAGNAASASYTWQVDTVRPRVKRKAPTGRRVSRNAKVTVLFSEPVQKALVVRRGKPAVQLLKGRRKVAAKVRYVQRGRTYRAVLDPKRRLEPRTAYRVVVTSRPRDRAGNALRPASWRFRTRR